MAVYLCVGVACSLVSIGVLNLTSMKFLRQYLLGIHLVSFAILKLIQLQKVVLELVSLTDR
jgi:hypothetical protein